ncbi:DUF4189 domain-containing protein [Dyella jiangningensis]|uniref:DUF4189 domain-containing protein n=1 Tax=Dyella jiangningensis TaxID=1379159 RepID=A0A328P0R0_9GAMM|nr:DUF4189 domain-containing protein [Dyella jiangningensis]RAO75770.1 hypothetical protein CA260_17175 [Dyella jiangningensis]
MKAIAIIFGLIGLLVIQYPVHAQVFPCSGNPGEVMVGEQPAGNGVASIPLCRRASQAAATAPSPPVYGPMIGVYGAIAVDDDARTYNYVSGQDDFKAAKKFVLHKCVENGGKSCRVLVAFGGHASIVADRDGEFFVATSDHMAKQAIRDAFSSCNKKSRNGGCTLLAPPTINGMLQSPDTLGAFDVLDLLYGPDKHAKMDWHEALRLGKDLNDLSAYMDTRTYWAATAIDGETIFGAYNQPDRRSAETAALKGCSGNDCKVTQVFKNTCAGMAWPKGKKPDLLLETTEDTDPAAAKARALAQCASKYGACDAQVRCSGRMYPNSNPDASDKPSQQ